MDDRKGEERVGNASLVSKFIPPKRYILAVMMFWGFVNMYAIRVNLNVAINAMVSNHSVVVHGRMTNVPGDFNWDSKMQGIILGAFYWGYMMLQIPGGWLAMKTSATRIFGLAILIAGILTLITPFAARWSPWALFTLRILEGLALGVMFPSNHQIWSKWAPSSERSVLVTLSLAGTNVGSIITMPLSALLTMYGFDGGWASVFYCFGGAAILWYVFWVLIVHDSPQAHPSISTEERQLIERSVFIKKNLKVPWLEMMRSKPVIAIIFANISSDWGLYTILMGLPRFLQRVLNFDIKKTGFIASLPFVLRALMGPVGGTIADILRSRCLSTTAVRKIMFCVGSMSAGFFILIAGYSESTSLVVACMCVGVAMSGLLHAGYEVNVLDVAPTFSGVLMGISNTLGTTTGFISPLMIGMVTVNDTAAEWRIVFWTTFLIYSIGAVVFCVCASGEVQPWAKDEESEDDIASKPLLSSDAENSPRIPHKGGRKRSN